MEPITTAMGMHRRLVVVVAAGLFVHWLFMRALLMMPATTSEGDDERRPRFNLSEAYIIALEPSEKEGLQATARLHLNIERVHMFQAINATEALRMAFDTLPLYTKLLFQFKARHDHMQLSSAPMLGCLLSHMAIWRQIRPDTIVAVLEEDAVLDEASAERLRGLSEDLDGVPWELLMLESGQVTATGAWRNVGQVAATCAYQAPGRRELLQRLVKQSEAQPALYYHLLDPFLPAANTTATPATAAAASDEVADSGACTWQGSRGYLLSYKGARLLLRYAEPIAVQVDGLMALVAMFEPGFRMYWPRVDVVHREFMRMSTIWDGCVKCYLPASPAAYVALIVVLAVVLGGATRCRP